MQEITKIYQCTNFRILTSLKSKSVIEVIGSHRCCQQGGGCDGDVVYITLGHGCSCFQYFHSFMSIVHTVCVTCCLYLPGFCLKLSVDTCWSNNLAEMSAGAWKNVSKVGWEQEGHVSWSASLGSAAWLILLMEQRTFLYGKILSDKKILCSRLIARLVFP